MERNSDPRALRTRRRLVAAYRELAAEGSLEAVTVRDVVDRAGINRTSFYAHFAGTEQLAAEALTEFFEVVASVDASSRRAHDRTPLEVSGSSISEVIQFVVDRRGTYAELLGRSESFVVAVEDAFADSALRTLRASTNTTDPEITARFAAAGVLGVVAWWLRSNGTGTPERLAERLTQLLPADFTRSL